ncbi:hypothetical protein SAM23877_6147 [Streptomyces ambofaciens ATCC 23877]|uniref:Uncharacterized protein n=1 Tax=Streptomyces ambofaciens (strain ATCC 23877 / 3486 / DSM 40053 / JCM 4204 / NBRC 12836 / NRRL B-2516) TaxID=278992 RepID=A0A0K2B277_STRA7|nr:hypothetical protein [Streptomyces ambofaciens]AKZ59192.1 hypothetical protein SAM23877_6147 [Streptomyces ambofaciens ATCC 23877]WNA15385.1 hypothetical protein SAMYPH_54 [Streptomyces phage Samy]
MATIRKPDVVIVEMTTAELELIRVGLRCYRTYEAAGADDSDALNLLNDLEGVRR